MELARLAEATTGRPASACSIWPSTAPGPCGADRPCLGEESTESLLERWSRPRASLFVGEYEGAVVGLLGVSLSDPVAGRVGGLIECCYVEPDARGVGVGSSLMEAAVAWGRVQGCTDIDALALPGDRQTKQRLEASGFTARLLTLSRRLD